MSVYTPSAVVLGIHNFYRLGKDPSINAAIVSEAGDGLKEYLTGVAFAPGIFVIVGLVVMLALCCKCCSSSRASRNDDYHSMGEENKRNSCTRVAVGMLVTLLLVTTLTAAKGGYDLNAGLKGLRGSLTDAQDLITTLNDDVYDLQADGEEAKEGAVLCPEHTDDINAKLDPYLSKISEVREYTSGANTLVKEVDPYERQVFLWLLPAFAAPLALLLLAAFFILMGSACPTSGRCSLKLGLYAAVPAILVLWFMTTVQMVWSVPAADYCVAPDNTTLAIFQKLSQTTDNDLAVRVFKSYIDCKSNYTNPIMQPLKDAEVQLEQLAALIKIVQSQCPAGAIEKLENATTQASASLSTVIDNIACENLNKFYMSALHVAVCGDLENGAVWLWGNGIITFFVLACLMWQALKLQNVRVSPNSNRSSRSRSSRSW